MFISALVLIQFLTADGSNSRRPVISSKNHELQRKLHFEIPLSNWQPSSTLRRRGDRGDLRSSTNERNNVNILRQYWAQKERPKSTEATDCVHRGSTVRPFPGYCYTHVYNVAQTQSNWWNIWKDIVHDVAYTFDFVLAPLHQTDAPRFYYFIMFLKSLAVFVDNPLDVLHHKRFQRDMLQLHNETINLIKQYETYEKDIDSIISRHSDLVIQMHKFQSNKLSLHTDITRMTTSFTNFDEIDGNVEKKVDSINIQTHSIKEIVNSFANIVNQNFYLVKDGMPPPGTINMPSYPGYPEHGSHGKKTQKIKSISFPTNIVANVEGPKISA